MNEQIILRQNAKTIFAKPGKNTRHLYPHQVQAISKLNSINKQDDFSALVVLPTGAGKTMTAATWLLTVAIEKNKKILWLAHRHLLLEQAADAFSINAFTAILSNRKSFKYRIVSGHHDRPIHIKPDDDILVVSKDSITRNLQNLDEWLKDEDTIYLVIDEAHHAIARSYRSIIKYVKSKVPHVKMLGLTATPFRTAEEEAGLLGEIFTDDIVYKIDLDTLIKRGILSTPICESCDTEFLIGNKVGLKAINNIENLDIIPENIAQSIAENKNRNHFIARTYVDNSEKYGPTIVFALNRMHALTLKKIFELEGRDKGIKAGVIVTGVSSEFIGIDISNAENNKQLEAYRNGKIQVLINVNILTEGVDLPKTQTVFLTRPTISSVLMTQMIGRALRGEKAGGTKDAYIVSFIDDWNSKIAWVNPESILNIEENVFSDKEYKYRKHNIHTISIKKLEEFTQIINETVDTSLLESVDFIERVPVGMYVFTFIDENSMEHNHQILVYNNSEKQYKELISALPTIFDEFEIDEEIIDAKTLNVMINQCESTYFHDDMIPPYNRRDIEYLLKFFAQKEYAPLFIPFDEVDRQKLDLSVIAEKVIKEDMYRSEHNEYIDSLWADEKSLLRVYFGNKYFLKYQLQIEVNKLLGDYLTSDMQENTLEEEIKLSSLPLYELCNANPELGRKIKDAVYNKSKTHNDEYCCALCGKKSPYKVIFQIDHIIPMSRGGNTTIDNLQLLCRKCNLRKSDKS